MKAQSDQTTHLQRAVIACQRFGLGPLPGEIAAIQTDPQHWLLAQISQRPAVEFDPLLPDSAAVLRAHWHYQQNKKQFKQQPADMQSAMKVPKSPGRNFYKQFNADALQRESQARNSFSWRCLDFFANHFSVSAQGSLMTGLAATLAREAIAPNLFAHFEDLLIAVCQHPAMLIYLNNENSIGPDSRAAKKNRGLNENLAREIMELHTLGVDGGYQQQDVRELAMAITGWTVVKSDKVARAGFTYRASAHQPGTRTLMHKHYPQTGRTQGEQMLKDLANHPNTARFICAKIVRHFISDHPPHALVDHLQQQWLASQGDLSRVFSALVTHPLSWQVSAQKYKTAHEFVLSTQRALGGNALSAVQLQRALVQLGQAPYKAGSPAGFSDLAEDWDGASALLARINWITQLTANKRVAKVDLASLINNTFGDSLSTHSHESIIRAESRQQALTLLLLSPEFLRR